MDYGNYYNIYESAFISHTTVKRIIVVVEQFYVFAESGGCRLLANADGLPETTSENPRAFQVNQPFRGTSKREINLCVGR